MAKRTQLIVYLACIILLSLGLFAMPYGYYKLLRVVISLASVWTAIGMWEQRRVWSWATIGVALVYNPVAQMHLGRNLWWWANVATLTLYVCYFVMSLVAAKSEIVRPLPKP